MSAPVKRCEVCDDTGSKSRDMGGDMDCTTCNAAIERMVMRNKLGLTWGDDDAWRAYQLGKAAAIVPTYPLQKFLQDGGLHGLDSEPAKPSYQELLDTLQQVTTEREEARGQARNLREEVKKAMALVEAVEYLRAVEQRRQERRERLGLDHPIKLFQVWMSDMGQSCEWIGDDQFSGFINQGKYEAFYAGFEIGQQTASSAAPVVPVAAQPVVQQKPIYWSLTYQGEHTANVFRDRSKAQETMDRLNKVYPDEEDAREIIPLYAAPSLKAQPANHKIKKINGLEVRPDGSMTLTTTSAGSVEFDGVDEWIFPSSARQLRDFIAELMVKTKIACEAQPAGEVVAWRTIDTAPKDGTRFLGVFEGRVGFWHWQGAPNEIVGWRDSFIYVYPEGKGPTHWISTPKLPAVIGQGEKQ